MSMSVKNRVAMFEGVKDGEDTMSPKGPSIKRPSTPNSFRRPATPTSPAFGQSFLKATPSSKAKTFNERDVNSPTGRSSWHLPAEGTVIPAPDMILSSKTSDNRRFSSSHLPSSTSPMVLTQKSPMSKSSVANVPFVIPRSSSKNRTTSSPSPPKKRVSSPAPKPVIPPFPSENKVHKSSENATKNKALQLAKSRNSLNTKPSKVDFERIVRDNDALSRNSDPELGKVNGQTMTSNEESCFTTNTMCGERDSPSIATSSDVLAYASFGQLSRAGKLSQAQRRSTTPDPVRSSSPMPAVRGAMTLSNVSHKEARKALLQAAQRKKEKADAIKQDEKEQKKKQVNAVIITEEHLAEDLSKRSEGSIADRVATKAMNVLKMKNSVLFGDIKTKGSSDVAENHRDTEGSCNGSIASTSSKLKTHPAFAARAASPRFSTQVSRSVHLMTGASNTQAETKVDKSPKAFTDELFSNFRHFNDLRPEQRKTGANTGRAMTVETERAAQVDTGKGTQGRPPQPSPMWNKSPRTLKEAIAAGKGTLSQSIEMASMMTENNTGRYSIDSNETPFELEESLHSTTEHTFDRKWMDSTGQPKYAASQQTFRQQEGGFLSSLSGNTFSNVSMISSAFDRVGGDGSNHPQGDISTPTMRSVHSMAQSIISTSPRVEPSETKGNNAYEYFLKSPTEHAAVATKQNVESIPSCLPSHLKEAESLVSSPGPSTEVKREPAATPFHETQSLEMEATKDPIIPIQASYSAADPPAGFVFHDDESDGTIEEPLSGIRDPEVSSFDERDTRNDKPSTAAEIMTKPGDKSSSTKGSISLRSGLSEVQCEHQSTTKVNESPREGSKSIHSGLSALQNGSDLEGSTSIRSVSVSMKSMTMFEIDQTEPCVEQPPMVQKAHIMKGPQFDTIVEVDDEEASAVKAVDEPRQIILSPEETETAGTESQDEQPRTEATSDHRKPLLPTNLALTAKTDKAISLEVPAQAEKADEDISVASSAASSQQSSKWKMNIPNLVKSVLAKASPKPDPRQTPKAQMAEAEFSSSDDEDDDIFGGLEDELSRVMGGVTKKRRDTPPTMKSDVVIAKLSSTPRAPPTANKFFTSGHSRKSEPPPQRKSATPQHRSSRTEARTTLDETKKTPTSGLTLKSLRQRLTSPRNAGNRTPVNGQSSNDRSGTEVVEQAMEHVNSDITSSVLGGAPLQKKAPETPMNPQVEEDVFGKTPKSKTSKMVVTTPSKAKTPKIDNQSVADKSGFSKGKDTLLDGTAFADETLLDEATRATSAFQESTSEDEKAEGPASMFMGFGCGLSDAFAVVSKVCHFGKDDDDEEEPQVKTMDGMDDMATFISADGTNNSSSHLTELEKRVWNEWDKLDSALSKANKSSTQSETSKEVHEKKREVARGKLLEIANSAISSQVTKDGEQSAASIGYTTATSSDSAETGNSSGMSGSSSEAHTTSSGEESHSYSSASEMPSEFVSEIASEIASAMIKPTTTPILLSFSQRSLIEKFSKQLTHHGVEVLKLNRRMQWQARYFAVSKEQVALIAHEANTKPGSEVAQCPKALLWLKKFSPKSGGYSLMSIDKNGHGGMLLVDLKDIEVSADHKDLKTPLPKKFADKFKDSVMVALEYEFNGEKRRIEFRCKDNDEAQFLGTCMRVIRDLLKREQALRLKTVKKKVKNTK